MLFRAVSPVLRRALAAFVLLCLAPLAQALTLVPYTAKALADAQAAGQPVALHFHAGWCPTCRAQDKVFEALKADPALPLTLLVADFDTETALKEKLHVTSQSTVIVYHGATERGRGVGQTDPDVLKATLRRAF